MEGIYGISGGEGDGREWGIERGNEGRERERSWGCGGIHRVCGREWQRGSEWGSKGSQLIYGVSRREEEKERERGLIKFGMISWVLETRF